MVFHPFISQQYTSLQPYHMPASMTWGSKLALLSSSIVQYALGHVDHVLYSICQMQQGHQQGILSVTKFKQVSLSYQLEKKCFDHDYRI